MLCFPGSRGSDLLYFQDLDKSCRHRSWILKLQESLTPFWLWGRGKSAVTLPCPPSTALPGRGAQHRVHSSRGQKAADTHKCTRWGYSHMVSQIWPSVGIFCAPDWWKGSSLSPHQLLPCRGRVVQNHCQTDLMAGRESRGLGGGSASLSPSLCDHKPPRHKIPFKQQWSSVLELVFFFYLHFFAERTNLVPRSSDGWKSQNFQPKFIRDPFIPICSCANTGLQFKQLSSLPSVNPPAPCFHRQQSHLSKPNKGCICCTSLQLILF